MKKSSKILVAIASVALVLCSIGSAAVSALSYINSISVKEAILKTNETVERAGEQSSQSIATLSESIGSIGETVDKLVAYEQEDQDVAQEDDVRIASEYYIRSTKDLSDAYKSGDTSALDDRGKETLKMASAVLDEITDESMTPYEKEKAVYEWLITSINNETGMLTVIPTTDADADNPFGVLKYRNAVCVGYATTFRLFMQMMDIDCMVVHDTSLVHSWDLVKLDDEWYHVDCYFDSHEKTYRHFNVNDSAMFEDHEWNMDFFPAASGFKYNYAVQNAVEIDSIYDIAQLVVDGIKEKRSCIACSFKERITAELEPAAMFMVERVNEIVASSYENRDLQYYWLPDENGGLMLCMFIYDYSEGPSYDVDRATAKKIERSLEDAFGDRYISGGDPDDYIAVG